MSEDLVHLLVVDDDRRIRNLLVNYLSDNGYRVSSAESAREARARMKALKFDLLVLDVMMPGENGLELSRSLRQENDNVPILFLSALSETDDKIEGLLAGGDDYLGKPFEPRELLLRVNSILRRRPAELEQREDISFGPFCFNLTRSELRRDKDIVHLTTREKDLLGILAQHAGQVVSRVDLSRPGSSESTRGVDVQINRLRAKIEENPASPIYLQTVRGKGYVLHVD